MYFFSDKPNPMKYVLFGKYVVFLLVQGFWAVKAKVTKKLKDLFWFYR